MSKNIVRIVLTGGPAAGKTTLISRILKEFKTEDGWRVIIVPETSTELISGFGIKPFGSCVTMEDFQYFVISDQLHKEKLALGAAEIVPEENVLIIYDRAVLDDKAYVSDEQFALTLSHFGKTEDEILRGYDAVLHLVSCAKGAEFAYNFGNVARYEDVDTARQMDERTLRAWSRHPNLHIIDNSVDFDDKLNRAMSAVFSLVGQPAPQAEKRKYLISMPDTALLKDKLGAAAVDMMQTYLTPSKPNVERRIRQHIGNGHGVGRANFHIALQAHIGEYHRHGVEHLIVGHGAGGENLAERARVVTRLAVFVERDDRGNVEQVCRIVFKTEAFIKNARHRIAAIGVAVFPNLGAHKRMRTTAALKHGRVVAHERKERRKHLRHAHFRNAVGFIEVIDGNLRGSAPSHHARAPRANR